MQTRADLVLTRRRIAPPPEERSTVAVAERDETGALTSGNVVDLRRIELLTSPVREAK
jgi:hypothetical protein